jgi:hypothetical protein
MEACGGDTMSYGVEGVNDAPYPEGGGDPNCGYDIGRGSLVMD